MRKLIAILGGFSLMSSAISAVSCADNQNDVFVLKTSIGEVIDTFNKDSVVDYYFKGWGYLDEVTQTVINFKDSGPKDYGFKSGDIAFWLRQLGEGLKMTPAQKKYDAKDIPDAVWQNAFL